MRIAIIGAGFGGLSAAAVLARAGHTVTVYEKTDQPGGRAKVIHQDGFTFDAGPSWYLMPDVFEEFFAQFGKQPTDYYQLEQLIPSYRAYFTEGPFDVHPAPAAYKDFDDIQADAGVGLGKLLNKTQKEYRLAREQFLGSNSTSAGTILGDIGKFIRPSVLKLALNPELHQSYHTRIAKYVSEPRLQKILEFMTVFLGGSPHSIPGVYGLLSWVDFGLGVWYPQGGFGAVARGFEQLAKEQGVELQCNASVQHIPVVRGRAEGVVVNGTLHQADAVLANADYHHVETALLDKAWQSYPHQYWSSKTLSPSTVIALLGVNKKVPLQHHNLFFDAPWDDNFKAVLKPDATDSLPPRPLFYVCAPSKTDASVAPPGHENLFVLIPVANTAAATASQAAYHTLVGHAIGRIEQQTGIPIAKHITSKHILAHDYFADTFNAYQANSFGLAHTRSQTGPLRPRQQSQKVANLFFAGQYTTPGTGVPLVVLSGQTAAHRLLSKME